MNNQCYGNFYAQPQYPAMLNQMQQNQNNCARIQYDFVGRYVSSYDDVRNAPFADQTMFYLDTNHDRLYIKEISKEGNPMINVLGICDVSQVQGEPVQSTQEEKKVKWEDEIEKLTNKIKELEKAIAANSKF